MRRLALGAAASLLMLTMAGVALGAGTKYSTHVSFDYFCGVTPPGACAVAGAGQSIYAGTVTSPRRKCFNGRRVNLYLAQKGPDKRLGYDHADSRGHWVVIRPGDAVGFVGYAKAPRKRLGNGAVCRADRSNLVAD